MSRIDCWLIPPPFRTLTDIVQPRRRGASNAPWWWEKSEGFLFYFFSRDKSQSGKLLGKSLLSTYMRERSGGKDTDEWSWADGASLTFLEACSKNKKVFPSNLGSWTAAFMKVDYQWFVLTVKPNTRGGTSTAVWDEVVRTLLIHITQPLSSIRNWWITNDISPPCAARRLTGWNVPVCVSPLIHQYRYSRHLST